MIQLVKKWLSPNRKFRNLVLVQSIRLGVALVFSIQWNPKGIGSNASKGMDLPGRVRASRQ